MRRYISSADATPLTDTKPLKRELTFWISAVSKQIETHLNRKLEVARHTEYFDTPSEKFSTFRVQGFPISALISVYSDAEGAFDGGESEISDCVIGSDNTEIVLPQQPDSLGKKTHRVIYTGGLALDGVRSTFKIVNSASTWAINKFVYGEVSEAVGIVKTFSFSQIEVENLYGEFEADETLRCYDDEDLSTATGGTATLDEILYQSLAESHPDIVRAAEMQTRYYWKHKDDFELSGTQRDSTNQRNSSEANRNRLQPEVMMLLEPYRRRTL
jgi:hypothetical protein